MARGTSQLTGFARFFIFLIIVVPLIFFGVTYFKGEDPMETIESLFNGETKERQDVKREEPNTPPPPPANSETEVNSELAKLRDEMAFKEKRITDLYRENEELKKDLEDSKTKLKEVQAQLDKIKSAIGQ